MLVPVNEISIPSRCSSSYLKLLNSAELNHFQSGGVKVPVKKTIEKNFFH